MRSAVLVILLIGLGACAQVPAPAGAPLRGHLQAGVYKDMHGWFSIGTPLAPTDSGYPQMSVSETYSSTVSLVGFSPLASPGEYYRVYVEDFYATNHPVPTLDRLADSAMQLFGAEVARQRLEPMRLVAERPWNTTVTQGLLRLYTERTPSESLLADLGMAEDYTAYILMYVTTQKGKVAMLWSEWPTDCSVCTPLVPGTATSSADPIEQAVAANGRAKTFMDSFRYQAD